MPPRGGKAAAAQRVSPLSVAASPRMRARARAGHSLAANHLLAIVLARQRGDCSGKGRQKSAVEVGAGKSGCSTASRAADAARRARERRAATHARARSRRRAGAGRGAAWTPSGCCSPTACGLRQGWGDACAAAAGVAGARARNPLAQTRRRAEARTILELLARKNQALLVRRDALLVLDLGLHAARAAGGKGPSRGGQGRVARRVRVGDGARARLAAKHAAAAADGARTPRSCRTAQHRA